jgi:hypothetical protein
MFRWIDIGVMSVIFSKSRARDAGGKPVPTFPHPALEHRSRAKPRTLLRTML